MKITFNLNPEGNGTPFALHLEGLKKIILREMFGEKHLLFLYENGSGWSFYPQQAFGKSGLDVRIKHLVHCIKELMMGIPKSVSYHEQRLVEKKIGCLTQVTWETIPTAFDHD